ncbi:MAG: sulfatase-like hydrolase/transferase [Oscillospiraceae bacterium]|nr:sulfatase-like hydrolase/transferase [Oscillospiraceae bacterium]
MKWLKRKKKDASAPEKKRRLSDPKREMLKTVGLLLLSAILLTLWCLLIGTRSYDKGLQMVGSYFTKNPITLLLNFLPVFVFMAVAFVLINRAWITWLVTSIFFLLIVFINYFKIDLRGEPFLYDDLAIAGDGLGILGEYSLHIPGWLLLSLVIIAGGTVLLKFFAKGKITRRFWWTRVATVLLCIGIGAFSWAHWYTDDTLYHNSLVRVQHSFNIWRDDGRSAAGGLFYSFLNSVHEAYPAAPEGYSEEAAEQTLAQYPDEGIPEDKKVNLIVTMLESYSDLSVFDGVSFAVDPYAELHALQEESYHGTLVDDSIGGGTVNAERSFLTGFAYRQPGYNSNTNSFVWYLRQNGYRTEGAHPGHNWFYSRQSIDRRLGFEEYYFHEGHLSEYITDDVSYQGCATDAQLFGERREAYENRDPGVPFFSFTVSYQGHSPYTTEQLPRVQHVGGLSEEADVVVNNYLTSVADTGKQIAAFVDSFRDDPEPVVLVFFGDHKPTLGDGQKFYSELGITGKTAGSTDRFRLYSTPYLIWANDAAKKVLGKDFTGEGPTISPCYLMSEVFDCIGWTGPAWMQFQRTVRDTVPVLHYRDFMLHDDTLTMTKTAEEQAAFDEFARIEYYVRQTKPTVPTSEED